MSESLEALLSSSLFRRWSGAILHEAASDTQLVQQLAKKLHKGWLDNFRSGKNEPERSAPRMRTPDKTKYKESNINVEFDQLAKEWKDQNIAAAEVALVAARKFPDQKDLEKAAEQVHIEWMSRNEKTPANQELFTNYSALPDWEKEKDRLHVRLAQELLRRTGGAPASA